MGERNPLMNIPHTSITLILEENLKLKLECSNSWGNKLEFLTLRKRGRVYQLKEDYGYTVEGWTKISMRKLFCFHFIPKLWNAAAFTFGSSQFLVVECSHHPDLHLVGWNNVKIEIWTHSVRGLTENDFILATKVNGLDVQHLLSEKLSRPAQTVA
ncbi:putative pterin-4-alpha-carbinolamine dehydratase [Capsicum baccatum]|uniref:4a-hydroxytetrahydrobiopterin dehydratase n=1 Tax=Capsicum baccatum TaxID=33114 RepID=A0A2G2VZ09_CAPBA|nr:putative pterin-4-alpha-carbinolamine dehydratase [Capsicum baccatum]